MADAADIARLNVLIEALTDFASVPDLDTFILSLGARAPFLVPFSRCVILLGDSLAHPSRIAIVREHGVPSNANVDELCPLEITLATKAWETSLPAVDDLRRPQVACYPIRSLTTLFGVLIFTADRTTYSMPDLRTVQILTDACAGVMGRIEAGAVSRRERAALAAIEAGEQERRRISRELHDEMGQQLAALTLGLKAIRATVASASPAHEALERLQAMAAHAGREMHRIALELRPAALDQRGLQAGLASYVEDWSRRAQVRVDFQSDGPEAHRLPPHVETIVYRIVQEALMNVHKHAKATVVSVVLQHHAHDLVVIVEDDGIGFEVERAHQKGQLGLLGMNERVALVGGTCHVESQPGRTSVFVRVPTGIDGSDSHG